MERERSWYSTEAFQEPSCLIIAMPWSLVVGAVALGLCVKEQHRRSVSGAAIRRKLKRKAFGNGYYLDLISLPLFLFDLAPKRETGGPKGRLFSFGAVRHDCFLYSFSLFSISPDTGYTIPKKLNQLFFKGRRWEARGENWLMVI